ncbi:MAG: rod-binding protein, partial [Salinibacterium sp.]|nr:rod-binding protein [Salinibacterium sp.]
MVDGIGASTGAVNPRAVHETDLDRLQRLGSSGDEKALREVGEKLEGVFVSMLVKSMREGMSEDGLFGKGPGADIYDGFFDQMMGEELSKRGGLGISEMVVRAQIDHQSSLK